MVNISIGIYNDIIFSSYLDYKISKKGKLEKGKLDK